MTDRRYDTINNAAGWLMFAIAAATYLLTLEPSASFWDCGEYIAQSYRLEVGHPPGNPMFALTARVFANFAGSPERVALMINAMSALLSAATIMLLFWTVTALTRRLLAGAGEVKSVLQAAVIMGAGTCGALAYTWSDTFWFSAVEAEVYAYSSLCTALTFWLILKWERRCDEPGADRYIVAIAYVVGLSIGVHLLNLLCVPAIALTVYYRKTRRTRWWTTLSVLMLSFAIIVLILYGMVPGYLRMAQWAELLFVNRLELPFNSGFAAYTALFVAVAVWTLRELYRKRSEAAMKASFMLLLCLSGMFLVSQSLYVPIALAALVGACLFGYFRPAPVRTMTTAALCVVMIFVGFSSYTIVLLRASSNVPMNVNDPDNVFALESYLSRDQYGDRPLFYGPAYTADSSVAQLDSAGEQLYRVVKRRYEKKVKTSPGEKDSYVEIAPQKEYLYAPEMYMFLPRVYNPSSADNYRSWVGGIDERDVTAHVSKGDSIVEVAAKMPSYWDNIKFFAIYQVHHMYWRYLMFNFVGRQNDTNGNGEVTQGNWLSGFPPLDNIRLGDQSLLPEEFGEGNAGHNVYYGLPLLLGLLGLIWQARQGREGKRQCWVVVLLFVMTGVAIVVYLNQIPGQARERDYSFAGSFYAYAIWIGMGVAALFRLLFKALRRPAGKRRAEKAAAAVAIAAGVAVPLQMVSQTWNDHDRSGRYFCRDYALNVLTGAGDNAILFIAGDNISFPLWYIQDTEGVRTDVRTLNTDYLCSEWYIRQVPYPYFEAPPIEMMADSTTYTQKKLLSVAIADNREEKPAADAMRALYKHSVAGGADTLRNPMMGIPVDRAALVANRIVSPDYAPLAADTIHLDNYTNSTYGTKNRSVGASRLAMTDIIATDIAGGWRRPICFVKGMAKTNFFFMNPYIAQTGLTLELTPFNQESYTSVGAGYTDRAFNAITSKFRWGGLDKTVEGKRIYMDEANRYMLAYTRLAILDLAERLIHEGEVAEEAAGSPELFPLLPESVRTEAYASGRFAMARALLLLKEEKLPESAAKSNYEFCARTAEMLYTIGDHTGNPADKALADSIANAAIDRFARHIVFFQTLTYWQPISDADKLLSDRGGFLRLIAAYAYGNPEAAHSKMRALEDSGVDIWDAMRRLLSYTRNMKMPRQAGNRIFGNLRSAYLTLSDYNPEKMESLLNENPKFRAAANLAIDYHDKFEEIKRRKLLEKS